jgi:hypothetical protein
MQAVDGDVGGLQRAQAGAMVVRHVPETFQVGGSLGSLLDRTPSVN